MPEGKRGKSKVRIVSIDDGKELEKTSVLMNELMAEIGKMSAANRQLERRIEQLENLTKDVHANDDLIVFDRGEMMAEIACAMVDRISFDKKIVKKKRVTELQ